MIYFEKDILPSVKLCVDTNEIIFHKKLEIFSMEIYFCWTYVC